MITMTYEGNLKTRVVHEESGSVLYTEAPKDNQGTGGSFSPTDLLAVSLGSCVLTLMGIRARRLQVDFKSARVEVKKEMVALPARRIGKITVLVYSLHQFPKKIEEQLEEAGRTCPVHYSLHPEVEQNIIFHWGKS